jgi:hypothetical protein
VIIVSDTYNHRSLYIEGAVVREHWSVTPDFSITYHHAACGADVPPPALTTALPPPPPLLLPPQVHKGLRQWIANNISSDVASKVRAAVYYYSLAALTR